MKTFALTAIGFLTASAFLRAANTNTTNTFTDDRSRASYAIGMMIGNDLKQQNLNVEDNIFWEGLNDARSGKQTLLTAQEAQMTVRNYLQKTHAELAEKNKSEGAVFLAKNKKQPGVVTLPDGLQYKIITQGAGEKPAADDMVTVNYRGTLIDGTEFDSSARVGHPAQFRVGGVIRGWSEALTNMPVGSKWQLFVPADLAYGERGRPGIPPNATLIFDVELLSIEHSKPAQAAQPLTSDIIKVPSADEMKNGAKIEVIKPEDVQKMQRTNHSQ